MAVGVTPLPEEEVEEPKRRAPAPGTSEYRDWQRGEESSFVRWMFLGLVILILGGTIILLTG